MDMKMRDASGFDRLPEAVAILVLSKLKHAQTMAMCSCVSRRWRCLVRHVDTLTFESFHLFAKRMDHPRLQVDDGSRHMAGMGEAIVVRPRAADLETIVSRMLLCTTAVRNLRIAYHPVVWPWIPDDHFSEAQVCSWLNHVAPSLEQLALVDPNQAHSQPRRLECLSLCKSLRWLNLCYGCIIDIPVSCHKFDGLQVLSLDLIVISDEALELLVELCPLLETLKLNSCSGLVAPSLRAPALITLAFHNDMDMAFGSTVQGLSLQAPRLERLSLVQVNALVLKEVGELGELDLLSHVRCSAAVQGTLLSLTSLRMSGVDWITSSITNIVPFAPSLRCLQVCAHLREPKEPLQISTVLGNLQELQRLDLGMDLFSCLQLSAARLPPSQFNLPSLETARVMVYSGDQSCVEILRALLLSAPILRNLHVDASQLCKGTSNLTFFSDVLTLQREFGHVAISLTCPSTLL